VVTRPAARPPPRRFGLRLTVLVVAAALLAAITRRALTPALDAELAAFDALRPPVEVRVVDREGRPLDAWSDERRIWAPLDAISPAVVTAVLVAEDRHFWRHPGVDPLGAARAAWVNLRAGAYVQGGSTLTQQLVKLLITGEERSLRRKAWEALLALRLEQRRSKAQILELYLNLVYLGGGNHGVEAAAQAWFGRSAKELGPGEAALLAGLIRAPSRDNPGESPERAREARARVLRQLVEAGELDALRADRLADASLTAPQAAAAPPADPGLQAARTALRREVQALLGDRAPAALGLQIEAAIDLDLQAVALAAVDAACAAVEARQGMRPPDGPLPAAARAAWAADPDGGLRAPQLVGDCGPVLIGADGAPRAGERRGRWARGEGGRRVRGPRGPVSLAEAARPGTVWQACLGDDGALRANPEAWVQGAAVVLDHHQLDVLALTGGRTMELEGFHRATQAARQPGSAFKPLVWAAALESGLTRVDRVLDGPLTIQAPRGPRGQRRSWSPQNYDGSYRGMVRLEQALAQSLNTVAVRLTQRAGPEAIAALAARAGHRSPLRPDLSLGLGTSEVTVVDHAVAIATLANGGWRRDPVLIRQARAADGRTWGPGDALSDPLLPAPVRLPGGPATAAVRGEAARQVIDMMRAAVEAGTGSDARSDRGPRAAKTGTTSGYVDAWFAGSTPQHTVVVWIGADDRTPLGDGETGARAALPAWVAIVDALDADGGRFPLPDEAVLVPEGRGYAALPRDRRAAAALGRPLRAGPLPPFPGAGG
jgi:penicillin-binding protein 1A